MFPLHKIPVSVLFIILSHSASCGDPRLISHGAAETGMNHACIMKTSFWSSFHNQALLVSVNSVSFGIGYMNRFCIPELGTRTAGIIVPAGKTTLGAIYSHSGYRDFRRQIAGIACGLQLSEWLSAGVQIDYSGETSPGEHNNRQSVTFETGIILTTDERVTVGLHVYNPVPNSLRRSYLPSEIRAGAGIYLTDNLFAAAETAISTCSSLAFRVGFEYGYAEELRVRGGFSSENTSFSFGIGYRLKHATIDLGFMTHERLGITSSISLVFEIKP